MQLGILTTARCNASCRHCSTSCGPQRTESLSREQILRLMDEAAALSAGNELTLALSGGEVFLDFPLLLELVSHGARLGAIVTCVTNGYWATTRDRARQRLGQLKAAGLAELAVSTSRFHEEFVSRRRVETVLRTARELGLRCTLKLAHVRSDAERLAAVRSWALAAGASAVQELPVLAHVRDDGALPEHEHVRSPGLPVGTCPAPVMTVAEDGVIYSCCTPGAFVAPLRLGSIANHALGELRSRFLIGGLQQILRNEGPMVLARHVQARGLGPRLRSAYAGTCDLCTHLLSDAQLAAACTELGEKREIELLQTMLQHVPAAAGI